MSRLRRLLARAQPGDAEVDILRGIAAAIIERRSERAGARAADRIALPLRAATIMFDRLREDIRCVLERDPAARSP